MQQHRARKIDSRKWRNANSRISKSATDLVATLGDRIGRIDSKSFPLAYLADQYLSKYLDESLTSSEVRRSKAISKWLDQERFNKETNYNFIFRLPGYNVLPFVTWRKFLKVSRRIVYQVLGPLTDNLVRLGSFSGGASTSRPRTASSPARKFEGKADITESAEYLIDCLYHEFPLLRQYNTFSTLRRVESAVLFTVPKKSDIDRCACKEPDINMYFQKGVGSHIRRRLRRFGINLNDQGRNRSLALQGSISNGLATIDLSSASDSITIEAVRALLPDDWFEYLNSIRSQSVVVDGVTYRTEMFSSMGNGFTFELESLIFYALTRATSYCMNIPSPISVYGDDIICSSELYDSLSYVLNLFGFKINTEKSYYNSPFRESCGGHFFNGIDVSPFYLRKPARTLTDLILILNQFRKWILADVFREYEYTELILLWNELASHVPKDLWGGYDVEIDTQLCAPIRPYMRLCRTNYERSEPQLGSYLNWHNSNWDRAFESQDPSYTPRDTYQTCRKRRAPLSAQRCLLKFHTERQ